MSHGWTRIFCFGNGSSEVDEFSLLGTISIRCQTSSSVCIRGYFLFCLFICLFICVHLRSSAANQKQPQKNGNTMRQIVLDTETTGLEPEQGHRIIEIGCVELINRRLTGNDLHLYINPERDIDAGAQQVHGITEAFWPISRPSPRSTEN